MAVSSVSFVYFSYGKAMLHRRTILSVLSIAANYSLAGADKILIFTDDQYAYTPFLDGLNVEYIPLGASDIRTMMGSDDLIHRVKIGIIEKASQLYPNNKLLYVDSDTFFHRPFNELPGLITPSVVLMHKFEYFLDSLRLLPLHDDDHFRELYEKLKGHPFVIEGKTTTIDPAVFASWNAGMIGLHPDHFGWLGAVYELTDQLYRLAKNHACEQFAFSYVLQHRARLLPCEQYNYHYWHKIEKQITDEQLVEYLDNAFGHLALAEKLAAVRAFTAKLRKQYHRHEYTLRYKSMIAFSEEHYGKGYAYALMTLARNPFQPMLFFKDVCYYTKKVILGLG